MLLSLSISCLSLSACPSKITLKRRALNKLQSHTHCLSSFAFGLAHEKFQGRLHKFIFISYEDNIHSFNNFDKNHYPGPEDYSRLHRRFLNSGWNFLLVKRLLAKQQQYKMNQ